MGEKSLKEKNKEIIDCEACNGVISIGSSMRKGAVVCCEECDVKYLVNSRGPLRLELLEDEEENIYTMRGGYDDDFDDFNIGNYGNGDDDYNDGRYD
jgi:hypothetical protein